MAAALGLDLRGAARDEITLHALDPGVTLALYRGRALLVDAREVIVLEPDAARALLDVLDLPGAVRKALDSAG